MGVVSVKLLFGFGCGFGLHGRRVGVVVYFGAEEVMGWW